jgi:hypothetical protein
MRLNYNCKPAKGPVKRRERKSQRECVTIDVLAWRVPVEKLLSFAIPVEQLVLWNFRIFPLDGQVMNEQHLH